MNSTHLFFLESPEAAASTEDEIVEAREQCGHKSASGMLQHPTLSLQAMAMGLDAALLLCMLCL